MMFTTIGHSNLTIASVGSKWLLSCGLRSIFLTLIHLLLELLCLFLIHEREPGHAFFNLEGVKEGPILIVLKCIVDFLIPYHTSTGRLALDQRTFPPCTCGCLPKCPPILSRKCAQPSHSRALLLLASLCMSILTDLGTQRTGELQQPPESYLKLLGPSVSRCLCRHLIVAKALYSEIICSVYRGIRHSYAPMIPRSSDCVSVSHGENPRKVGSD